MMSYHVSAVDGRVAFRVLTIGHVEITVYALDTAMHGAVNIFVPRVGYVCFKPPTKAFGVWWPWYLYISPDGTPNRARVKFGRRWPRRRRSAPPTTPHPRTPDGDR